MKADHPFFWSGYMLVDTGASAVQAEKAPAKPILKFEAKGGDKPAEEKKAEAQKPPDPKPPVQAPPDPKPAVQMPEEQKPAE